MSSMTVDVDRAFGIVQQLADAKGRHDVAATMAIYHPMAVLESPCLGTHYAGTELRRAIEGWFAFAPDYEVQLDGRGLDGSTLCCWGRIFFTPAFTRTGAVPNGRRVSVPVFMLFRFTDYCVAWESFNFDVAGVARQSGVDANDLVRQS